MEIKVSCCSNCPFMVSNYDDYAVGFDTVDYCNLTVFLKYKEDTIDAYDSWNRFHECDYCKNYSGDSNKWDETKCTCNNTSIITTPEWCPLKNEIITIKNDI